jgi:phytanoyl-CoA dioxygenase PhyH
MQTAGLMETIHREGFVVLPEPLLPETVSALIDALKRPQPGAGIREGAGGAYAMRRLLQLVPEVRRLCETAPIRSAVESILGPGAAPVRGLLLDKTPGTNWKVGWHQDLIIAVRERVEVPGFSGWSVKAGVTHAHPPAAVLEKMLTLRIHLDECGEANGPLKVLPGSHLHGKLTGEEIRRWRERVSPVLCVAPRGGILLMRPLLLHASSPAAAPAHRRVLHLEFASDPLPGGLEWAEA